MIIFHHSHQQCVEFFLNIYLKKIQGINALNAVEILLEKMVAYTVILVDGQNVNKQFAPLYI